MRKLLKDERIFIEEIFENDSWDSRDICLYCGEKKKKPYSSSTSGMSTSGMNTSGMNSTMGVGESYPYWYTECNCEDAKKERLINKQIKELESQIPQKNYIIEESTVLKRITDWTPEQLMVKMTPDEIRRLNENTDRIIEYAKKIRNKEE